MVDHKKTLIKQCQLPSEGFAAKVSGNEKSPGAIPRLFKFGRYLVLTGQYRSKSIILFSNIPVKPYRAKVCTSVIRGCAFVEKKRLQRKPYKASLNSKAESGMGEVCSHKSATTARITMLWPYAPSFVPFASKARYLISAL